MSINFENILRSLTDIPREHEWWEDSSLQQRIRLLRASKVSITYRNKDWEEIPIDCQEDIILSGLSIQNCMASLLSSISNSYGE